MKRFFEDAIANEPKWQEPAEWMALGMLLMTVIMVVM